LFGTPIAAFYVAQHFLEFTHSRDSQQILGGPTMQRFLVALVLIAILVGAVGFYRGWFSFATTTENHNTNMTLKVDKDKFNEDKEKAEDKLKDIGRTVKEKVAPNAGKDDTSK
jgi:hypothetical protein